MLWVQLSDCKAAVYELDGFEDWLDTSQFYIMNYPAPQASMCLDPNHNITMHMHGAIKASKDVKVVSYLQGC